MNNYRDKIARAIAEYQSCGYCEGTCQECLGEADAIMPILHAALAQQAEDIAQAITDTAADPRCNDGCSPMAVRHGLGLAAGIARQHASNGGR